MNVIDIVKNSWIFDDHFKGITGPLIAAFFFWIVRSLRRLVFPFVLMFKMNLSSNFLKLTVDDKINALKLISEYKDTDEQYDVLMKELKLKQYGLFYPLPILQILFNYVYDKNIRMNSTGLLSFLDCNQIFDYDRHTMPIHSWKKIGLHLVAHAVFVGVLIYYAFKVFQSVSSLYHAPVNFINLMTLLTMVIIIIVTFRFIYIIVENSISFFWAILFSKKLNEYVFLRKKSELIKKYKIAN